MSAAILDALVPILLCTLRRGTQFYKQLGELVKVLHEKVDDFVRSRTKERESFVVQIETKRRLTSSVTSSTPPLVPEKPRVPPPPPIPVRSSVGYESTLSSSFSNIDLSPSPLPLSTSGHQESIITHDYPRPQARRSDPAFPPPPPYYQPPTSPQTHTSSPPVDPYADLFNTPGIPSAFSLDTSSSSRRETPIPPPQAPTTPNYSSLPQQHPPGGYYSSFPPPPAQLTTRYGQLTQPLPPPPPPQRISSPSQHGSSQYSQYQLPPPPPLPPNHPQSRGYQTGVYSSPGKNEAHAESHSQWFGQGHGQQGYGR